MKPFCHINCTTFCTAPNRFKGKYILITLPILRLKQKKNWAIVVLEIKKKVY